MAKSQHDKIAVVSGGANGIGQAFAQRLAQDGAHIVIADIASGSDTVKMVEQAGRLALARICDVSSLDSVKAFASDVTKHFGRCDILINCPGIFPNQPFDEMTFADLIRIDQRRDHCSVPHNATQEFKPLGDQCRQDPSLKTPVLP